MRISTGWQKPPGDTHKLRISAPTKIVVGTIKGTTTVPRASWVKMPKQQPKRKRGKPPKGGKGQKGAYVNIPYKRTAQASGSNVISGTDRVHHVKDISKLKSGEIIYKVAITPNMVERLATAARNFQRIRYRKLRFDINVQMPTNSGGGYVAGFVADPTDEYPEGEESLKRLTANKGSVCGSMFKSFTMNAKAGKGNYYTSPSTDSSR